MTNHLRIGIDIDNVVANSYQTVLSHFNKTFMTDIAFEKITYFNYLEQETGFNRQKVQAFFLDLHFGDFSLTFAPYPDSVSVISSWIKKGCKIHFITARPEKSRLLTSDWLKKHGLSGKNVSLDLVPHNFSGSDVEYKKRVVKRYNLHLMIEDHPEIANSLTIPVFLLDRPWNRVKTRPGVTRVFDWIEIGERVSKITL